MTKITKIAAKQFLLIAGVIAALQSSLTQARADYAISPPVERYKVVLDNWHLVKSKNEWTIKCAYKGSNHSWPVDQFLLADRLDSNSICSGKDKELTESYLEALSKMKVELGVELTAGKKSGPLAVAGIWSLGEVPKYNTYFCQPPVIDKAAQERVLKGTPQAFVTIGSR